MNSDSPSDMDRLWADANLHVTKIEFSDGSPTIFRLQKQMVINGITHVHSVWLNLIQLRNVAIDQAL
jgi:hypothetical protein